MLRKVFWYYLLGCFLCINTADRTVKIGRRHSSNLGQYKKMPNWLVLCMVKEE